MANKKPSINDIAKHLNVAKSTVSFIINGKAEEYRISKKQEQRVLEYIQKIGYKPNYMAKSLATGKTNSIGLIVENIGDSFFGPIALIIEEQAKKYGYRIIYSSTLNSKDDALSVLQLFKESQVDGFIIAPPKGIEEGIKTVLEDNVPVLIFDRMLDGLETDYVGTNNKEVSEEACEHLLDQGFKHIAFISLASSQSQMQERLDGYLHTMSTRRCSQLLLELPFDSSKEYRTTRIIEFLQRHPEVDAVFFSTNYLCISGLQALRALGMIIPDDVGVLVFDEHDLFRLYTPAITSISQPLEELGEEIVKTLLQRIVQNGNNPAIRHTIVPSKLNIRESTIRK